jgi:hypothetical protein
MRMLIVFFGEQQGVCYAFVEFEEPAGAQGAIEVILVFRQDRSSEEGCSEMVGCVAHVECS